jgi:hypothetical protein
MANPEPILPPEYTRWRQSGRGRLVPVSELNRMLDFVVPE